MGILRAAGHDCQLGYVSAKLGHVEQQLLHLVLRRRLAEVVVRDDDIDAACVSSLNERGDRSVANPGLDVHEVGLARPEHAAQQGSIGGCIKLYLATLALGAHREDDGRPRAGGTELLIRSGHGLHVIYLGKEVRTPLQAVHSGFDGLIRRGYQRSGILTHQRDDGLRTPLANAQTFDIENLHCRSPRLADLPWYYEERERALRAHP